MGLLVQNFLFTTQNLRLVFFVELRFPALRVSEVLQ
jgi:hypothetical protein